MTSHTAWANRIPVQKYKSVQYRQEARQGTAEWRPDRNSKLRHSKKIWYLRHFLDIKCDSYLVSTNTEPVLGAGLVLIHHLSRTCQRFHPFQKRTERKCYIGRSESKGSLEFVLFSYWFWSVSEFVSNAKPLSLILVLRLYCLYPLLSPDRPYFSPVCVCEWVYSGLLLYQCPFRKSAKNVTLSSTPWCLRHICIAIFNIFDLRYVCD